MGISHEALLDGLDKDFHDKVEEAEKLYTRREPLVKEEYLFELCEGDQGLTELLEDMLEYFYRYTRDVCEQEALKSDDMQGNMEEIKALENPRTVLHNAMMDSVKILIRNLRKKGKDVSWAAPLDNAGREVYAWLAFQTTFLDILKRNHS